MAGTAGTGGGDIPQGRSGLLLIVLVAAYLVAAVTQFRWGGAVHAAFVLGVALLTLRRTSLARWQVIVPIAVCAAGAGIAAVSDVTAARGAADIWNALALLFTVVILLGRVLRLDQVTAQSIYAALSAYLLIGLMFTACYGAIGDFGSGAFFAHGQPATAETLQYFSFTTLTTLGYGDFTAVSSVGRAVAVLEALTGQIFLATLVARLVSAYRAPGARRDG